MQLDNVIVWEKLLIFKTLKSVGMCSFSFQAESSDVIAYGNTVCNLKLRAVKSECETTSSTVTLITSWIQTNERTLGLYMNSTEYLDMSGPS